MKKCILSLFTVCILIMTSLFSVFASENKLGDVDGNGTITAADARLALRASVGLEKFSVKQIIAADVDGKSGLTASDARLILRASVGLENLDKYNKPDTEETKKTVSEQCIEIFRKAAKKSGATTKSIAEEISKADFIAMATLVQDMSPGYFAGFNAEITGFKKCTAFVPMIGTIPFVSYVFEISPYTDVDSFIKYLKDNANLRWNICTKADEMCVVKEGKFIFFIMSPLYFESNN